MTIENQVREYMLILILITVLLMPLVLQAAEIVSARHGSITEITDIIAAHKVLVMHGGTRAQQ